MRKLFLLIGLTCSFAGSSQTYLQPGFSGKEYRELLEMFSRQEDNLRPDYEIPAPTNYKKVYRSPEVGLMNRWELWYRDDNRIAVINIRGTIQNSQSWLENFYAAMVTAQGSLQINDSTNFTYQLAADSNATVHVGWLLGLAHLSPTILQKIDESYKAGIREFFIFGHSQGGALAYLVRSHLHYLQQAGKLPADIFFKTYCSAGPKPGNLFYAYDFDFITRNGWAFNVVNAVDWVPQTPFSVQTLDDYSKVNPFANVDNALSGQNFFVRLYLKDKFRKMDKATTKAQKRFEQYLGRMLEKQVKRALPQYQPPKYVAGNNYQRAAMPIVLQPDAVYKNRFPDDQSKVFVHHLLQPYYYLSKVYYP
jgi:hypothetical protein